MHRITMRSRALFVLLCLALCACERVGAHQVRGNVFAERALISFPGDTATDVTTAATGTTANTNTNTNTNTVNTDTNTATTATTATTTTAQQTTETQQTTATTAQTTAATNTQQTTDTQQTQATATENTQTNTQQNTPPTQQTQPPSDTVVSTTDANGSAFVTTVFVSQSLSTSSTSSASASPSSTSSDNDSSGGIGTGSIIGMSVAGGVAVIGVVAFFIWKFTRKRFSDFDDEPIKWPELNSHNKDNLNYALPTTRAMDAGAGAGLDSPSEVNLTRNASGVDYTHSAFAQPSQYSQPAAADSTADLYAPGGDPYAIPPLPHLNPNQPYRDDPAFGSSAAYYDPYRGPVPQTFNDAASVSSTGQGYSGEAIPMNNLAVGGAVPSGRQSPGPQMGLDMGRVSPQPPMAGRQSPGPSLGYGASNASSGYGVRASPAPGAAMAGRASPGPGAAYGGGY